MTTTFSSLGIAPDMVQALGRLGITTPSPVQAAAIPPALAGSDILACAQTGSGKTLAFGLPLVHRLARLAPQPDRLVRSLILVPTRELAIQVGQTLSGIAAGLAIRTKVSVVFGGVSVNPQMLALRGGTDVLVATPGRLIDLLERNAVSLNNVQFLVLDEADRLLDQGFSEELNLLLKRLPGDRQSLFFSATFPPAVQKLADSLLRQAIKIDLGHQALQAPDITQRAILVDTPRRTQLLRHLISTEHWKRVLVFVATKHAAEIVADKLRKVRIYAEPFHGELSQGKRSQVLSDFKASRLKVVVATDMASRGLDISELPVVVNYDLPRSAADYTHRIGRTGRAGQSGLAISFVSHDTEAHFRLIEKRHQLALALETVAGFEPEPEPASAESTAPALTQAPLERPGQPAPHGGIKGKRPNKKDKLRAQLAASGQPRD